MITDGWITTRVKSKFVGEELLKGTVLSAAARARAIEQAKEVEGVHRVVDQLTIGPKR